MRDPNSNSEPSTLPPKVSDSTPPFCKVSDKIWTPSNDLWKKVLSNSSISVTRVSTGSTIETQKSQSPEKVQVPLQEPSNNETTYVQVIPPSFHNPTPKIISREETSCPKFTPRINCWGSPTIGNNT